MKVMIPGEILDLYIGTKTVDLNLKEFRRRTFDHFIDEGACPKNTYNRVLHLEINDLYEQVKGRVKVKK